MEIDWDLLARYLADLCTDAEREALERWLAESSEHRQVLEGVRATIGAARRDVPPAREVQLLASLRREIGRLETSGPGPSAPLRVVRDDTAATAPTPTFTLPVRRSRWPRVLQAAAAVLLLVGGAAGWWFARQRPATPVATAPALRTITTTSGQRLSLRLPDGTLAVLAPGSTLRLASTYGARDRVVQLEGQALFTVTHDSTRPFAVHTAHAVARDIGTRFVVKAYAADPATDVVVAEGLVSVGTVVVARGDRARITPDGRLAITKGVPLDAYFAWADGQLVFRNTPLTEVAAQLSRWYDIDVRLASDQLTALHLTASARDEPAADVLRMVAASLNLDLTQRDRTYILRAK